MSSSTVCALSLENKGITRTLRRSLHSKYHLVMKKMRGVGENEILKAQKCLWGRYFKENAGTQYFLKKLEVTMVIFCAVITVFSY